MRPLGVLSELSVKEVTFTRKGANQPAKIMLFKSAAPCPMCGGTNCGQPADVKHSKPAPPAFKEKSMAEAAVETVSKSEFEKLQKALDALQAESTANKAAADTARVANEALTKSLAAQVRVSKVADITKFVSDELKALPGVVAADFAEVLMSARESAPEATVKAIETALVAASKAIAAGPMFKAITQTGASAPGAGGSAASEYDDLVAKKIAANGKLSKAEAGAAVVRENRDLYERMETEQADSIRAGRR